MSAISGAKIKYLGRVFIWVAGPMEPYRPEEIHVPSLES